MGASLRQPVRCKTSSDQGFRSALGENRTPNLLIRSQMLYPLSYECGWLRQCSSPGRRWEAPAAADRRRLGGGEERAMSPRIARAEVVGREALLDFLRPRHKVVLVTTRSDGAPQLSPVTAGLDEAGRIVIATYPERAKSRNARLRPPVSLLVLSDEWDGAWVQIDGMAEVLDLPEALDPLVDYFRAVAGEHGDWDEYRAAMRRQGKALLRVTIRRWGPIATGGFPARLA